MKPGYCKSCFREVPEGSDLCPACAAKETGNGQKIVIIAGLVAIPIVLTGMGALNARQCLIGVVIAAAAALLYVALGFRSG